MGDVRELIPHASSISVTIVALRGLISWYARSRTSASLQVFGSRSWKGVTAMAHVDIRTDVVDEGCGVEYLLGSGFPCVRPWADEERPRLKSLVRTRSRLALSTVEA